MTLGFSYGRAIFLFKAGRNLEMKVLNYISKLSLYWKFVLAFFSVGLIPTFAAPVMGAERISLSYGSIEQSIPIHSLETFVKTGELENDLVLCGSYATSHQLRQLRQILQTRVLLKPQKMSRFLDTPMGEQLVNLLAYPIGSDAHHSSNEAIRSALILAAADPEGLTLLNVLREFPSSQIEIDLGRSLEMIRVWQTAVNQSNQAIAQIEQQAILEATTAPLPNWLPVADLRQPGRFKWKRRTITLNDRARDRRFQADIYLPLARKPHPVIAISHGLGSNRSSFSYLAKHLASYGFVVVVPEHPGSNGARMRALFEGRINQVIAAREFIDRPLDVKYLLDELERLSQTDSDFRGRLNLQQVGIIGQSFGAYTALVLAGAKLRFEQLERDCFSLQNSVNPSLLLQCRALDLPRSNYDLADARVKAAIAINPVGSSIFGQASLRQIKIPVMTIAGTADTLAPALPEQIEPFSWLTSSNKYFVLLTGGTHYSTVTDQLSVKVNSPTPQVEPDRAIAQNYLMALSTAFAQTYVAQQPGYNSYLSAAYANKIRHDSLPLNLVRAIATPQLVQAANGFNLNYLLFGGISAQTVGIIYLIAWRYRAKFRQR